MSRGSNVRNSAFPAARKWKPRSLSAAQPSLPQRPALIEAWQGKLPKAGNLLPFHAAWEQATTNDMRPLLLELAKFSHDNWAPITGADFFPDASDNFEIQAATEMISNSSAEFEIRKLVKKFSGDWAKAEISGVMVLERNDSRGCTARSNCPSAIKRQPVEQFSHQRRRKVGQASSLSRQAKRCLPHPRNRFGTDAALRLYRRADFEFDAACVLPVIALEAPSASSNEAEAVRRAGFRRARGIYAVGVLLSFLALAAGVIGVKAAGHHAGWGMQFGSPVFIVCLTTLVTLVALNLFGIFEVTLGGSALDSAGELASKHGAAGAFFNGVLATHSCHSPAPRRFWRTSARGFAFAQSASVIVLVFLTVGLGLASPYILLSWNPAWLKFLPKPGAWMEKFKIAMGFPMLATVVWLFDIAASSYGKNVLWLGIFSGLIVAFAAWIFGEFVQRGRSRKTVSAIATLILLFGGYAFALEKELNWREAMPDTNATGSLKESPDGIDWQRWSPEAVAQCSAPTRKPVLVDFTADWCLTCQVNKKTSLEISSVRKKLKDLNVIAFVGDYTHFPDAITTELRRYSRAGVPLVLIYPKDAAAPPIVLPEVLTPGIVLGALDRAAL